jgi:2-polyprenyl-6-methoxyphenol hydroxylase-like FAD-dependent oxidoreductase
MNVRRSASRGSLGGFTPRAQKPPSDTICVLRGAATSGAIHARTRDRTPSAPRNTQMVSLGGFTPRDADRLTFMVGPKHQFGYSMMGDDWGWWCHAHGETEADRKALLMMPDEDLRALMLARYAGWADPVRPFIEATEGWLRTLIQDVPTLPTWHKGRVLLIGDAAHAMSPAGGQGASLALEDAMVFSRLVADPSRDVEDAMARFESARRARAEGMVAQAFANDRRTLKELGPVGMWTRDRVMMPLFASFIERALTKVYTAPLEA